MKCSQNAVYHRSKHVLGASKTPRKQDHYLEVRAALHRDWRTGPGQMDSRAKSDRRHRKRNANHTAQSMTVQVCQAWRRELRNSGTSGRERGCYQGCYRSNPISRRRSAAAAAPSDGQEPTQRSRSPPRQAVLAPPPRSLQHPNPRRCGLPKVQQAASARGREVG